MSEPGAGSDARRLRTKAERDGDHYVVNGDKCWISRGSVAGLFIANVTFTDEAKKGLLLIESDTPGVEIGKVEPLMGHRGSPSTELFFRDCRVPVEQRMSEGDLNARSEEHTSELQSLMRISYAVFCLKKKTQISTKTDYS